MVEHNKIFQIMIKALMVLLCLICILPFILLLSASLTDEAVLFTEGYSFIPKKFSLDAYRYLLQNSSQILRAYFNTIMVTVVGTIANLAMTILLAYPLSRKNLPGKQLLSFVVFFTMLFNGGVVSTYIMYTQYFHIKNTYAALIVPNLMMGAFYVIMVRSYFTQNIPEEVLEAAKIDGAGEWKILFQVVLPMSVPIMATIALMVGLQYWNDWINGLYYVNNDSYYTIQILLNNMIEDMKALSNSTVGSTAGTASLPSLSMKMAVAVIGIIPILCVYPFFQKFFVKGITVGAVKG